MDKAKTANRYSTEVRSRAVRMVPEHGADQGFDGRSTCVVSAYTGPVSKFPPRP